MKLSDVLEIGNCLTSTKLFSSCPSPCRDPGIVWSHGAPNLQMQGAVCRSSLFFVLCIVNFHAMISNMTLSCLMAILSRSLAVSYDTGAGLLRVPTLRTSDEYLGNKVCVLLYHGTPFGHENTSPTGLMTLAKPSLTRQSLVSIPYSFQRVGSLAYMRESRIETQPCGRPSLVSIHMEILFVTHV